MKTKPNDSASPITQSQIVSGNLTLDCTNSGLSKLEYFSIHVSVSEDEVSANFSVRVNGEPPKGEQTEVWEY